MNDQLAKVLVHQVDVGEKLLSVTTELIRLVAMYTHRQPASAEFSSAAQEAFVSQIVERTAKLLDVDQEMAQAVLSGHVTAKIEGTTFLLHQDQRFNDLKRFARAH